MPDTLIKKKGRPRKLNIDQGIDIAMHLFWQYGFDGVSISSICKCLNVPPTSIYSAYQNKGHLFKLSMSQYMGNYFTELDKSTENVAEHAILVRKVLETSVNYYLSGPNKAGCMLFEAANKTSNTDAHHTVTANKDALFTYLLAKLQNCANENSEELSHLLFTMLQGISARLRDGASEDDISTTTEFFCVIFD